MIEWLFTNVALSAIPGGQIIGRILSGLAAIVRGIVSIVFGFVKSVGEALELSATRPAVFSLLFLGFIGGVASGIWWDKGLVAKARIDRDNRVAAAQRDRDDKVAVAAQKVLDVEREMADLASKLQQGDEADEQRAKLAGEARTEAEQRALAEKAARDSAVGNAGGVQPERPAVDPGSRSAKAKGQVRRRSQEPGVFSFLGYSF